jgi:hypothetical protein
MRLRSRRTVVVWSSSRTSGGRDGLTMFPRRARRRPVRRFLRVSWLVTAIGLLRFGRAVRYRWKPLLAGVTLVTVGVLLRGVNGGMAFFPGVLFLYSALLVEVRADAESKRRVALERELATYSTPAQRRDLGATLDRYPDTATGELRDILARQATDAAGRGIPGRGGHLESGAPSVTG